MQNRDKVDVDNQVLRRATDADVSELARLNERLLEDEQYDRTFERDELVSRMGQFLAGGYEAYFITNDGIDVGYLLVNTKSDPLYIRHFYVKPEYRRQSHGRRAIAALLELKSVAQIDVEVMAWNEIGMKFWEGIGFRHRYNGLRLSRTS